jgi:wobble nucleotide-excising tRNase
VLTEKRRLENDKVAVRKTLDEYTNRVAVKYEKAINRLLEDFHTGFRITKTSHAYPGGVASSTYQISINDTAVGLGDSDTPLDVPSFKNTLSSGDKSTLALAIFLAQLEQNPDKSDKIV